MQEKLETYCGNSHPSLHCMEEEFEGFGIWKYDIQASSFIFFLTKQISFLINWCRLQFTLDHTYLENVDTLKMSVVDAYCIKG